jgi:hypothetical protein
MQLLRRGEMAVTVAMVIPMAIAAPSLPVPVPVLVLVPVLAIHRRRLCERVCGQGGGG